MDQTKKKRGCLAIGLLGCLGLFGLGIGITVIGAVLGFMAQQRPVDLVQEDRSQRLPASAEQLADARSTTELQLGTLPENQVPEGLGTIELDLAMGEFTIAAGDGDGVEVNAEYDRNRFELIESLEEQDDGTWRYAIALKPTSRILGLRGDMNNHIEILLPRGVPMQLVGEVKMGESEIDLGGLWIEDVDLELSMGEHTVEVSEPTAKPIETFRMEGRMGQVSLRDLGNARPRDLFASHRMGQLDVDLTGDWDTDGYARVSCRMGECSVFTPDDVHIDIQRASAFMGESSVPDKSRLEGPPGAPTLSLNVSVLMGEVRVR